MKYTSDGKKVAVIGKLNATETIVQEIFVCKDGSEIPSGEHFVVKSLHDAPVMSWHAKQEKELKESITRLESRRDSLDREVRNANKLAECKINSLKNIAKNADVEEALDDLADFVSGRITHVVVERYSDVYIGSFDESIESTEYGRVDGIKLLSLFGKSDGTLRWRIHQYTDHSGGSTEITPARGIDDAYRISQDIFNNCLQSWRNGHQDSPPNPRCWKNNPSLVVPNDVTEFWRNVSRETRAKNIARIQAELKEAMESENVVADREA